MSQMYNVEQYTDEECFRILSFQDLPNDEILEKRIIEYRDKYADRKTEKTIALYDFFSAMYNRFFDDVVVMREGFQEMIPPSQIINGIIDENEDGIIDISDSLQSENMKSIYEYDSENKFTVMRDTQYFKGQLNPLLKETIKRTININSSDRDKVFDQMHALTTDFNFSLEETLKNVVSLKLYAVQVPFTWYTIDDSFGSNIIYLKSDTPGLQDSKHQYYFSITPGNYNCIELGNAVNTSLQTLKQENPSVNFGTTSLSYNPSNIKATFQLDIQKIYDTQEFIIDFENDPNDNSYNNLATFMCFSNKSTIGFEDTENYLVTDRQEVNNNTLETIEIVRYSARFDSTGKMMDISSHLVEQRRINPLTNLQNEETLLQIVINPELGTEEVLSWINAEIGRTPTLKSESRVYDVSGKLHWDINFDKDTKYLLVNQRMALKITGSDTSFGFVFPPTPFSKYVDLYSYRYMIDSNSPVVPPNVYNMAGMRVVLFNHTARNNNNTEELIFMDSVDMSFSLTVSSNLVITDLIPNIINQLNSYSGFSILGREIATSNTNTNFTIDVSRNKTYNGQEFLNDFSAEINPGIDFSGGLYNVFLFRSAGVDVSSITMSGESVSRTSFSITNSGEFVYTSYRPLIGIEYGTNQSGSITFIGNSYFPDFSLNIDISLSNTGLATATYVYDDGIVIDINLKPEITTIENDGDKIPLTSEYHGEGKIIKSTLTIKISRKFTTSDYSIYFFSDGNVWANALKLESSSYNLSISGGFIQGNSIDTSNKFRGSSQKITISTSERSEIYGFPEITLTLPTNPDGYSLSELIDKLNDLFALNVNTYGSYFELIDNQTRVRGYINITHIFTTQDYNLVFYDESSFESCNSSTNYFRAAKSNTTLGFILGFRSETVYVLRNLILTTTTYDFYNTNAILNAVIILVGDAVVSVSLYNKLFIVLEDYNQNHMNDGLVSVSQRDTRATLPVYALRNIYNCNPETNDKMNKGLNGKHLTNKQIYSMNQIIEVQNQQSDLNKGTQSLKDVFAIVPIKYGLSPGDIFVEFGGTLQVQERSYFGPVNISRLRVKLLTDRGDVINLNNADWSFQIICEQLWQNI